jgi:hypothetical protein
VTALAHTNRSGRFAPLLAAFAERARRVAAGAAAAHREMVGEWVERLEKKEAF